MKTLCRGALACALLLVSSCAAPPVLAIDVDAAVTLARDSGQWNDVPDNVRSWFKSVRSPLGVPCCDVSDGHRTQWEIRTTGYFVPNPRNEAEWIQVPPESIVHDAGNPTGDAVVWWVPQGGCARRP
jgi:hypothetical protein